MNVELTSIDASRARRVMHGVFVEEGRMFTCLSRCTAVSVVVLVFALGVHGTEVAVAQAPLSGSSAGPNQAAAAPPVPRYEVRRATSALVIDGRMDERAWQTASPVGLRALWDFQTGPVQATTARLLWTDDFLYVGYEVEDADITAQYTERDDPTYLDDAVEIFVNPRPEQTGFYYGLEMNARAVLFDYVMYARGGRLSVIRRFDMKGVQVASHLRGTLNARGDVDAGWSLEVAIPWSNFVDMAPRPSVGTTWTANLNRWDGVEPDRRMSIWSDPLQARSQPHVPERFGELRFVE